MKQFLLLLSFFISVCAFSQANDLSWYKTLKGKVDKYPVTLHVHKAGHNYVGYYYYDSQQKPIYFSGDDTSKTGKIELFCYADADNAEIFIFSITGSKASGQWKKTENSDPSNFSAEEIKSSVDFTYVFTNGSVKLRPEWKESPSATYNAASVWPVGETVTDEFLKTEVRKTFNEKNTGEEIGALLLRHKKNYLNNYINDNKNVQDADLKKASPTFSMEDDSKLLIAFESPKLLTFAFTSYAYTGGAHGNHGTSYSSYDLTANKALTLDDIITPAGKKTLHSLLEKNFRKQFNLKPADPLKEGGLFENKIEPNKNFYVTGKGIGFCYNPYEIGPYVMGEINIFIPFSEMRNYLKDDFRKLIE